jgi:hypothetical protein
MSSHLQVLDKMLTAVARTFLDIPSEVRKLGTGTALRMYWSWLLYPPYVAGKTEDPSPSGLGKLKLKGYPCPFFFRHGASDVRVIRQIFLKEQYRELQGEKNVRRIIDCGANIGCSAVYFLSKYPDAELIAIEPDEDNCRLLRKNLEPFGERARSCKPPSGQATSGFGSIVANSAMARNGLIKCVCAAMMSRPMCRPSVSKQLLSSSIGSRWTC